MEQNGQSRAASACESVANIAAGYFLSLALFALFSHFYGWNTSTADNFTVTTAFTVLSLARSYALRRAFNRLHARAA